MDLEDEVGNEVSNVGRLVEDLPPDEGDIISYIVEKVLLTPK